MSESRGESRYKDFSTKEDNFFRRVRFKTGSSKKDIGDNRKTVMKKLEKELKKVDGDER